MKTKNILSKTLFLGILTISIINITNVSALTLNKNIKEVHKYVSLGKNSCTKFDDPGCLKCEQTNDCDKVFPSGTTIKYDIGDNIEKIYTVIKDDNEYIEMLTPGISTTYFINMDEGIYYTYRDMPNIIEYKNKNYENTLGYYTVKDSKNSISLSSGNKISYNQKGRALTIEDAVEICGNENICPEWIQSTNGFWIAGTIKVEEEKSNPDQPVYNAYIGNRILYEYESKVHEIRAVIKIKKFEDEQATTDNNKETNNTTTKADTKSDQTVKVDDTFKTAYIGYCIGSILLILGIAVMYQTYKKSKAEIEE